MGRGDAAAEWGVAGLIESVSSEVTGHGVTAGAVPPAGVETARITHPATHRVPMPRPGHPLRSA